MFGHIQCVNGYSKDLAKAVFEQKTMMNFDAFLYILGIPIMILTLLLLGVNTVFYLMGEMSISDLGINYLRYIFATFITPMLSAIGIILLEGKKLKPMWKAILMYPIFMGSWIVINIKSILFPNKKWDKITHSKSVGIDEINH
ncbi:MAG: hypothetical protein HXK70_03210 [Clostridiales bacterium]|nr:hypothetical protein [Clostridiales bacterium]